MGKGSTSLKMKQHKNHKKHHERERRRKAGKLGPRGTPRSYGKYVPVEQPLFPGRRFAW